MKIQGLYSITKNKKGWFVALTHNNQGWAGKGKSLIEAFIHLWLECKDEIVDILTIDNKTL